MFQKIKCHFGVHKFQSEMLKLTYVMDSSDGQMIYRVENTCVCCGYHWCNLAKTQKISRGAYYNSKTW